ncbi:MAG TPA: hypothetical protein VHF22_04690 [Planctomycetota bacterium]|jgi:hypothetical protein|nr:hypothetical protein [Planctomycetota bacterium]
MRRILVLAALVLLCAGSAQAAPDLSAYRGLGTWIDIYDGPAWNLPEATVSEIAARHVSTLFLETSNDRAPADLFRPDRLGRLLDAAHRAGIEVVAWYLPSFANLKRDLRRSLAAIRYRSPSGEAFDGFALDIESPAVKSPARRTARLLTLSRRLRAAVGPRRALGAITPSPRGMELTPTYWPGFPWAPLADLYDVFLPMTYFTYRVDGGAAAAAYLTRSIAIVRQATGRPDVPIHLIGGIGDKTSRAEARGFMRAVAACAPIGYSIYDFFTTRKATWAELVAPPPPVPAGFTCA